MRARRAGAAVAILVLAAVGVPAATGAAGATEADAACNGRAELCDRRLDEIAFPATHNSNASRAERVLFPNQRRDMGAQLRDGIRAFQIDAFLGTVREHAGRRVVFTDLRHQARTRFSETASPDVQAAARLLRRRVGAPPRDAAYQVYLCHNYCELGAVPMRDEARRLARFLDRHPRDVVLWIVQDELPAAGLMPILRDAGLDDRIATVDPAAPMPTLRSLIDAGTPLVMGLEHGDLGPRIPNVFDRGLVQEVPYRFERPSELRAAASCRPLRGSPDAPLFQFNHWITPASREASRQVNAPTFLGRRARDCARERGLVPNVVAVDFYEVGDVFGVTRELNDRS